MEEVPGLCCFSLRHYCHPAGFIWFVLVPSRYRRLPMPEPKPKLKPKSKSKQKAKAKVKTNANANCQNPKSRQVGKLAPLMRKITERPSFGGLGTTYCNRPVRNGKPTIRHEQKTGNLNLSLIKTQHMEFQNVSRPTMLIYFTVFV